MTTLTVKRHWDHLYFTWENGEPGAAIRGGLLDAHREILTAEGEVALHGWTETLKGGTRQFLLTDGEKRTLLASFLPPESRRCPLPPPLREIEAKGVDGDYRFQRQRDRSVRIFCADGELLCTISPFFAAGRQQIHLSEAVDPVLAAGFYLFAFWMVRENQVEII